ncbi:MAG TPA: pitrilysin family protein [Hyphomicrobiales bacterium]|nr:pitrilysin family protein [Hyphomicrobiales bacterium]
MSRAKPATAGLAAVERVVSPGGIEAWLVEEATVPIIVVDLAFRGGAAFDPPARPGVANLLSGLLDEGAGPYDSEAFQQRLEEHAVELSFHATRDAIEGNLRTLAEKRDEAFELLRLAVTEARLDPEPIGRVGAQVLARIRHNLTEPGAVAEEAWHAAAFPGHAYGRPVIGTEPSLGAIEREDLVRYRATAFTRDRLIVTVVGAIDAATLAPALDRIFGALPASAPAAAIPAIRPAGTGRLEVVPLAVPQTTLLFGRPGLDRHDPDYIAATVANHIVGGGTFTARLFTEVREKRGLAYSVHTWLDPMRHSATVMGGLATKNERAREAIDLVASEIRRFVADGPSADELDKAKKYLTGSYALNFDSSVKIARGLKQIRLNDLPIDYIQTRNAQVAAVAPADIARASERLFGDGDLFTVAVGEPVGLTATADAAAE